MFTRMEDLFSKTKKSDLIAYIIDADEERHLIRLAEVRRMWTNDTTILVEFIDGSGVTVPIHMKTRVHARQVFEGFVKQLKS